MIPDDKAKRIIWRLFGRRKTAGLYGGGLSGHAICCCPVALSRKGLKFYCLYPAPGLYCARL